MAQWLSATNTSLSAANTSYSNAPVDNSPDARFYWLLTEPDQDYPMVVTNFAILKAQALEACQLMDNGVTSYAALKQIQAEGPYQFEAANDITSSGTVIYCPWHQYAPNGDQIPSS